MPWPDIVWTPAEGVASDEPGEGEQAVAVTVGPKGFVAVGYREGETSSDGLAWFSRDGRSWTRVAADDVFAGVEMLDVTAAPGGFIGLGIASTEEATERPHAAFFRSTDGQHWQRLTDVPDADESYPTWLTGDESGVIATGADLEGHTIIWRSADGRRFDKLALDQAVADELTDPQLSPEGIVTLGSADRPPVLLRSSDARNWTDAPIDPAPETRATSLVMGDQGIVVQGLWDPGCDAATTDCEQRPIGWWSPDGHTWTRLPDKDTPIGNGASIVVPAGKHGVVAIDGASAWASPSGWGWEPLPEPSDGSMVVFDAVVAGDLIVAVGAMSADDGTGRSAILVAGPPDDAVPEPSPS